MKYVLSSLIVVVGISLLGVLQGPRSGMDLPRKRVVCETLYAPTAEIQLTDDIDSIWKAPKDHSITIVHVWCESVTGTVTINLQRDDGGPADITTADLICASTPVDACASGCTTTLVAAQDGFAAGDRLDLDVNGVAANPTTLNVCWEYQYD